MSWKERIKEFGGGNFTFLSVDGDTITFIVVGEPVLFETMYKKQAQQRIGCPVVTDEGYQLFVTGKRVARKLSKLESSFASQAIMVIRRGNEGDVNTRYDVRVLPEAEKYAKLAAIRDADFKPEMVQESVEEAKATLGE